MRKKIIMIKALDLLERNGSITLADIKNDLGGSFKECFEALSEMSKKRFIREVADGEFKCDGSEVKILREKRRLLDEKEVKSEEELRQLKRDLPHSSRVLLNEISQQGRYKLDDEDMGNKRLQRDLGILEESGLVVECNGGRYYPLLDAEGCNELVDEPPASNSSDEWTRFLEEYLAEDDEDEEESDDEDADDESGDEEMDDDDSSIEDEIAHYRALRAQLLERLYHLNESDDEDDEEDEGEEEDEEDEYDYLFPDRTDVSLEELGPPPTDTTELKNWLSKKYEKFDNATCVIAVFYNKSGSSRAIPIDIRWQPLHIINVALKIWEKQGLNTFMADPNSSVRCCEWSVVDSIMRYLVNPDKLLDFNVPLEFQLLIPAEEVLKKGRLDFFVELVEEE